MWFLFGFITLFVFIVYSGYNKFHASRIRLLNTSNGKQYGFQFKKSGLKGKVLKIGIAAPEGYNFSLKKEASIDKFFKKIGISAEYQTGDSEFDNEIYIASDDSHLHKQLTHNKALLSFLKTQFKTQTSDGSVKEITGSPGFLMLQLNVPNHIDGTNIVEIARKYVPILYELSRLLSSTPSPATKKDPFIFKAIIILGISSALAINGMVQFFRISYDEIPFTIDRWNLFYDSILAGSVITLILAITAIALLKRSARAHLVLIEIFFIGFLGSISTSYAGLRDANMEFDASNTQEYQVKVLDKWTSRSRRSTSYFIKTKDWTGEDPMRKTSISSDFFKTIDKGTELKVTQKTGYLNYRWIESIEKNM